MNAPVAADLLPGLLPPLHPAADASSMMTGVAVSAILLGVAVSMLAAWLNVRLVNHRRGAASALRQAGSRIAFRDALLATGTDSIVVLSGEDRQTASADGANALLMTAMRGPDSRRVAAALAALMHEGHSFDLAARGAEPAEGVAIRGRMVAGHAVAYAKSTGAATAVPDDSKLQLEATAAMLEGLPMALAVFDGSQKLQSCNGAFARTWKLTEARLATRPTLGDILDHLRATRQLPEHRDFASWKAALLQRLTKCTLPHEEHWHLAGGTSLRVMVRPHLLGGFVLIVDDVSEKLRLEASFKLLLQVQRATLDAMDDAVAIFGPDGRLVLFNACFAKLWRLGEDKLSGQPHFTKVAGLVDGRDGIWEIVCAGIASAEPERCNDWGKARRTDGHTISLSMKRLPNGSTIATFRDLTDRFDATRTEGLHVAA